MNKLFFILILAAASSFSLAEAKEKPISISTKMYPVPLDGLGLHVESDLLYEAADACGSQKDVVSLKDIKIEISSPQAPKGLDTKKRESLTLFYPDIQITAIATCKDR